MRLKFVTADNPKEAAFLAALRGSEGMLLVDEAVNADGCLALLSQSDAHAPATIADRIEASLLWHGVDQFLINRLLPAATAKGDPARLLARTLGRSLHFAKLPPADQSRFMLVGPPAAGKTTLIGKLAARPGHQIPAILTTDWERPGGIAQLAEFLRVLGHEPIKLDPDRILNLPNDPHTPGDDPLAQGPVLLDTAGIDAHDAASWTLMRRLAGHLGVEPILVLPALIDPDEARTFAKAARDMGAQKLIVTRLDIGHRMGALLAAADCGLSLAGGSITPHFAFGLKRLTPTLLARHLLGTADSHKR